MGVLHTYRIKYIMKGECYHLPSFDNALMVSLIFRELVENYKTIDMFLYRDNKLIDSVIKYNGNVISQY